MTNTEALSAALTADPDNEIVRLMLRDELMESERLTKTQAKKRVRALRVAAVKAQQLAAAALEIRPEGVWHADLVEVIRAICGLSHNNAFTIVLEKGSVPPVPHRHTSYRDSVWFSTVSVTVGAEWVLDCITSFWAVVIEQAQAQAGQQPEYIHQRPGRK